MGRKLIGFGLFCCLLFVNTVESESANRAPSKKRLSKEEKAKILKDFEEFESQIAGTITSVVKNLHQEDECSDRDKNANGNCPKPTPGPPIDFGEAGESLLKRVEIVEQTVFALLPSNCQIQFIASQFWTSSQHFSFLINATFSV